MFIAIVQLFQMKGMLSICILLGKNLLHFQEFFGPIKLV